MLYREVRSTQGSDSLRRVVVLVLSRKRGEKIRISNTITITVVEVKGDKVRIGIDAPENIEVHREEIYDKVVKARSAKKTD